MHKLISLFDGINKVLDDLEEQGTIRENEGELKELLIGLESLEAKAQKDARGFQFMVDLKEESIKEMLDKLGKLYSPEIDSMLEYNEVNRNSRDISKEFVVRIQLIQERIRGYGV